MQDRIRQDRQATIVYPAHLAACDLDYPVPLPSYWPI